MRAQTPPPTLVLTFNITKFPKFCLTLLMNNYWKSATTWESVWCFAKPFYQMFEIHYKYTTMVISTSPNMIQLMKTTLPPAKLILFPGEPHIRFIFFFLVAISNLNTSLGLSHQISLKLFTSDIQESLIFDQNCIVFKVFYIIAYIKWICFLFVISSISSRAFNLIF